MSHAPTVAHAVATLENILNGTISGRISEWPQIKPAIEVVLRHVHHAKGGDPTRQTMLPCDCGCARSCCAACGAELGYTRQIPQDELPESLRDVVPVRYGKGKFGDPT